MDSTQINSILSKHFSGSGINFLGVFPCDKIPSQRTIEIFSPCCYIANTEPNFKPGEHWVAIFHPNSHSLEFFDSYGSYPTDCGFHFHKFMNIQYNNIHLQSLTSEVCGQYSIYFLHQRSLGIPMPAIASSLKSLSHSKSDALVSSFIQNLANKTK